MFALRFENAEGGEQGIGPVAAGAQSHITWRARQSPNRSNNKYVSWPETISSLQLQQGVFLTGQRLQGSCLQFRQG